MPGKDQARNEAPAPVPLLFLIADTGGGHRNAARAVGQALDRVYPGLSGPVRAGSNDEIPRKIYVST